MSPAVPKPVRRPKSRCTKCGKAFTARALLKHGARCGGRNRFGNVARKTKFAEYTFDSRLERDVYVHLSALPFDGARSLLVKPKVYLTAAKILCVPDFLVIEEGGTTYHEAKGIETPVWRIKRRLWMHYAEHPLVVWKRRGTGGIELVEVIVPKRSAG